MRDDSLKVGHYETPFTLQVVIWSIIIYNNNDESSFNDFISASRKLDCSSQLKFSQLI